jgi:ubiquinone/menaquinone biosynthesis C-methylase UbiE
MTDYLAQKVHFTHPDIANVFDELSLWSSHFGRLLLENIELMGGISALDIGFGTGFPLFELAQAHGRSCQFTGVDVWKSAMDRAAIKRRVYGLDNVGLVHADGAHLPFADRSFDLIVSNLGINNFDNARAVMAECARVAKLGARLVITTNIKGHMREFYDVYRQVLEGFGKQEYLERLAANEDHRGTKESVCGLLEGTGFKVVKVIERDFAMRYLDGSALLRHFFVRLGFLDAWRAVVTPEDERAVFAQLERRLNALAERQGELKLTIPMLYVEGKCGSKHSMELG